MLHLVVGGTAQGKLNYVLQTHHFTERDVSETAFDKPIFYRLHQHIRQLISEGIDPIRTILDEIEGKNIVLICDELGCGIVPVDRFEREWREAVGRACCAIAKKADVVEQVHCGIPIRVKG